MKSSFLIIVFGNRLSWMEQPVVFKVFICAFRAYINES